MEAVMDELAWHALPRLVCEVREVPGLIPVFTSASVTDARVEGAALTLRLESGETVSCDEYRRRCLAGEAFRGFAFAVVTAAEDRVLSLAVPPVALPHRLALVRPEDPTEFALCVLQMFLENCPAAEADAARCLRLGRWLERARAPPAQKLRRLLHVGATRALNTLMFAAHLSPLDETRVLPHYPIAQRLLSAPRAPPVVDALFAAGFGPLLGLPGDAPPPDGLVRTRPGGALTAPLRTPEMAEAVYRWWTTAPRALTEKTMFVRYE
ncbi:UL7 [Suid alphaherpesvirus 1]|uniref:UL7 n=1 Tax=Suid herpesvirus 1 TaxID=10345 RepID=A0A0D5C664_SUHV|nr:UL7 [Suid alphaherpesvirus 1]